MDLQIQEPEPIVPADNKIEEKKQFSEEDIQKAIDDLCDYADKEDIAIREFLLMLCKKLDYYWRSIQYIATDFVARDYRDFLNDYESNTGSEEVRRVINLYKAYGESIIAAMCVDTPETLFFPADGDNPLDIRTAKAFSVLSDEISKDNASPLLTIKAIWTLYNQHFLGFYNYSKEDDKYGVDKIQAPDTTQIIQNTIHSCPNCDNPMQGPQGTCPACDFTGPMNEGIEEQELVIPGEVSEKVRTGICLECYGPINIKISYIAKDQSQIGYLRFCDEKQISLLREEHKNLQLEPGEDDIYWERWARNENGFYENIDTIATERKYWLKPWWFNQLGSGQPDLIAFLKEKFPKGLKATYVGDTFIKYEEEALDDHWSLSINPMSHRIYTDPLGKSNVDIADMNNDLVNLELQTVEYGIPQMFADPAVLSFDSYRESSVAPGDVFPAKPRPDRSLSDGFFMTKTTTLSQEVKDFHSRIDQAFQFVSAAMPAIWGGTNIKGSATAAEYGMRRSQALQRLSLTWKIFIDVWTRAKHKSVVEYAKVIGDKRNFIKRMGRNYSNITITKFLLQGKVGLATPESYEKFPTSWAAQSDKIMQLMTLGNEAVNQAIFAPENREELNSLLGFRNFSVPGADSRNKQLQEIVELMASAPLDDHTPSIQINIELDDHFVEGETIRAFLISDEGQMAKNDPQGAQGFNNCMLHYLQHKMAMNQPPSVGETPNASPDE